MKTDSDRKNRREFNCASCGAFIAQTTDLIMIEGAQSHSHINPAGLRLNFVTIGQWDNALAGQELYLEHSWFNGYGWRFMVCSRCMAHLGWVYDALTTGLSPSSFAGLLISSVNMNPVSNDQ